MKLIGATVVYNEEEMIPYVMPYVERMGYDKFIVYDDGCTDNTIAKLSEYPFVEIRQTDKSIDHFEHRKKEAMISSMTECWGIIKANGGESVWLTFTDFDEVLYCSRERNYFFKDYLDMMDQRGFNYFDGRMLHLTWDGVHSDPQLLPHQWDGVRGTWWLTEGRKVTLIKVNNVTKGMVFCGNHYLGIEKRGNVEMKNLEDSGEFHGFHMKYFDRNVLGNKTTQLVDKADHANQMVRANSFPLDMYFLIKGFNAQRAVKNPKDPGEGLFMLS